jgi:hypothetical protein
MLKIKYTIIHAILYGNISDAHGVHIKSDLSILDPTILERLGDRGLFAKIPRHAGGGCFS